MLRIRLRIQKCTRIQPKCRTLPHLRSLYSRYSLMALGRLSLSRAPCSTRGRPICCRITRRHRSIRGSGSAATNKQIWMYWRTYSTKNLGSINLSNILINELLFFTLITGCLSICYLFETIIFTVDNLTEDLD